MKLLVLCLVAVTAIDVFPESNRKFTSNLYKALASNTNGDFIVCPLSLQLMLGLLHTGAEGDTAKQLAEALHLPNDGHEMRETYRNVTARIEKNIKYFVSSVVNKIYVHDQFQINPSFSDIAKNIFKADVENVNFKENVVTSDRINSWVEEKTKNNIKNFISARELSPDAQAVLVNSMYLQGLWDNVFTSVKKQKFYTNHSNYVETDMMEQKKFFMYYEDDNLHAKILKMKYHQSRYALVIVLPNDQAGLSRLEENILETLREPHYINAQVQVRVPKFKANMAVPLIPILQQMGVRDVFKTNADLGNVGSPSIYVNQMMQRNYIDVNENGTIATSATRASARLGRPRRVQEKEFVADHPFLYYIRSSVGIAFVGRFTGTHL